MTQLSKYALSVSTIYLWIGFVCAISFMEAWLKFQAPGVSLKIGLGIGRLVFNALNKVEWVFVFVLISNLFITKIPLLEFETFFIILPFLILIIQSVFLLPNLDARAELRINEQTLAPSNLHFYYVGAEIIKVISLVVYSFKLIK